MLKLIGTKTSPYVRKMRVALAERRIEYALDEDSPWAAGNRIGEYTPLGKVPILLTDDGTSLFDSRVIVEYVDLRLPGIDWRAQQPQLSRLATKLGGRPSFADTGPPAS